MTIDFQIPQKDKQHPSLWFVQLYPSIMMWTLLFNLVYSKIINKYMLSSSW